MILENKNKISPSQQYKVQNFTYPKIGALKW